MTPTHPTSSHLVPTSSQVGDDLPGVTSSLVPHPYGDEVTLRPSKTHHTNTPPARPRDELDDRRYPRPRTTFDCPLCLAWMHA